MKKLKVYAGLLVSALFFWLYIPHISIFLLGGGKRRLIAGDLEALRGHVCVRLPLAVMLVYMLHTDRYFRTLFYHRAGRLASALIGWYRPGDKYFTLSAAASIGRGFWYAHPYSTIIAADSIGENFRCVHCVTIGNTGKGRPRIGDNVSVGAGAIIIGNVSVGNNVSVGAGCVVVKDIPDFAVVVGNPARIVKYKDGVR